MERLKVIFLIILLNLYVCSIYASEENIKNGNSLEIKILDKVNSQNSSLLLKIGEEKKFQNLMIKALRCNNSKFDENEINIFTDSECQIIKSR